MGDWLAARIEAQRASLPLWAPALFGCGIAGYFALPSEPGGGVLLALAAVMVVAVAGLWRGGSMARLCLVLALLPALGFAAAALRTRVVAAPVLPYEMTAAVEGRVVGLGRSASDRTRVLLDRVVIHGLEPERTPAQVRISIEEGTSAEVLRPGARVLGQARLSPPAAPSAPGGFDFRRVAWFDRLGAVGYARSPLVEVEGGDGSPLSLLAFRLRMVLSAHIQARMPGQEGAFSAAILTGDRSAIDPAIEEDLRDSTLYHLVSISGLHMTLIAASVFVIVRGGLAFVPGLALRWPLKKIAAWGALAAGFLYLALSGFEVPAQRAYVMTACVLGAVLLDRPALTLRSVALAALVVLVVAPESLMEAGFQMSFAATIALVAVFDGLRGRSWWMVTQTDRRWRLAKPVLALAMTSLVAGSATAPFSAFHFNVVAQYGLVANMLAVPMMGAVVMPAAVVAAMLAPLGLDWLPFAAMGWGVGYVLAVAHFVSGLGGAVSGVPSAPGIVPGLVALGGLVLVLWNGRGRWAGLAPLAAALALWAGAARPPLLIAPDGRLFGFMTAEGRAISSATSQTYAAATWLEDDGDVASQEEAHARADFRGRRGRVEAQAPGFGVIRYVGFRDSATGPRDCADAAVLIAPQWRAAPPGPCLFIGAEALRQLGALSVTPGPGGFVVEGALAPDAGRPWASAPRPTGRDRPAAPTAPPPGAVAAMTR
ncbi:ComEC/Rec2 family competence protein [Amaricoccus sp.]|uniref:ComEC/Rec2 family competence protein n=1 Tax=Amaricoccus sp. TaxID=1872485 RepID=UPI001B79BD8D|nr:ComEC/Rec2 family competence protein [Amaricoccus sp.]MBP7241037.1 ComEC/Rec2 family competence protein [Amaricoccus sp.]